MKNNKILTIIISLLICMNTALGTVVLAENSELTEEELAAQEELNKALFDETLSEFANQAESVVTDASADYWIQYEGDRTGMSDSEIVYRNWFEYYLKEVMTTMPYLERARMAIKMQTDEGLFSDVNYTLGNFSRHFGYCSSLYVAYAIDDSPENELYQDPRIPGIIEKAMEALLAHKELKEAMETQWGLMWWQISIGAALSMQPSIVLCRDILPRDLVERLCDRFFFGPDEVNPGFLGGTNQVWYATEMIIEGAILDKPELIRKNINYLVDIVEMTSGREIPLGQGTVSIYSPEGVRPDGAFHQHGAYFYTQYMSNCLADFTKVAMLTLGTEFEPKEYYDDFLYLLLNGGIDIYRGTEDDFMRNGRVLAQATGIPKSADSIMTYRALRIMQRILPERAEELEQYIRRLLPADDPDRINAHLNKHYYNSDYMVHHRDDFFASCTINTKRTVAVEFDPKQGKNSWNINMGQINIIRDNDTVQGTFPCWDWRMMPGVTCPYNFYISHTISHNQDEIFGGGVSNGEYGMTAMKLSDHMGVSAKKAYFFFDNEIMLLGAGINAFNADEINTGVDRRRINGDVLVDGKALPKKGVHSYKDVSRVFHSNMGFVFPDTENIVVTNNTRTGDWAEYWYATNSMPKSVETMFELRMSHGKNPVNDTYNCIILPMTTQEEFDNYVPAIDVVENSKEVQAVWHNDLKVGFAVFYHRGEVKFNDNLSVKVDSPALVMIREKDGVLELSMSDPYAKQTTINAEVEYNGKIRNEQFKFFFHDEELRNRGGRTETRLLTN